MRKVSVVQFFWKVSVLLLALIMQGRVALATIYFQDGINYATGTVLGNNSPWAGPQSTITVSAGSLTYSNLTPVSPGTNSILVASNSSSVYSYAPLNTTVTSGNVYMSFLVKYTAISSSFTRSGLLQTTNNPGTLVTTNDPIDLVDHTNGNGYELGIRGKGGSSYYVTNAWTPLQLGNTYLVVMRYKFSDGSASLWINPPVGGSEPSTADATSAAGTGLSGDLKYLYFRAGKAAPGYYVDNVQVGSTWQDVTSTAGTPAKMVVTLPGQTFNSGAGNSGSPSIQTSLSNFNITISAVVSDGVTLATNYSGTKTITYTGPLGASTFTTNVIFNRGQALNIPTTLTAGQITTLTATDGSLIGIPSSSFTVISGFYPFMDSTPGFFSGVNMWFTNVSGLTLYTWSTTNPGLSVSNWTLEGMLQAQTLSDVPGSSRYSINVNPTISPTYYVAGWRNSGPYVPIEDVTKVVTTDFTSDFVVTDTNVSIATNGVLALIPPPTPTTIFSYGPVAGGGYRLKFNGNVGQPYTILVSSNYVNWSVLSSGIISTSPVIYTESAAFNHSQRFYRVSMP